jgi:hypothetical protein
VLYLSRAGFVRHSPAPPLEIHSRVAHWTHSPRDFDWVLALECRRYPPPFLSLPLTVSGTYVDQSTARALSLIGLLFLALSASWHPSFQTMITGQYPKSVMGLTLPPALSHPPSPSLPPSRVCLWHTGDVHRAGLLPRLWDRHPLLALALSQL